MDYILAAFIFGLPLSLTVGFFLGRTRRKAIENNGEAQVRKGLVKYCSGSDAHVLSNVTLRFEDGSTTQIDHILVSTKGIFVIETKDYKGWIFANPKSKVWTQTIYKNKNKFQNPIFQNYKHVKAIEGILDFLEPQVIYNLVVFTGEAVFKTAKPENVLYVKELIPTIKKYTEDKLSLNRVQFCVGRLEYQRLALTRQTDIEHKASLIRKYGNS